jgi:hypothetical protein
MMSGGNLTISGVKGIGRPTTFIVLETKKYDIGRQRHRVANLEVSLAGQEKKFFERQSNRAANIV